MNPGGQAGRRATRWLALLVVVSGLVACSDAAKPPLDPQAGIGPRPSLPAPQHSVFPTVRVAKARGWAANGAPKPAPGLRVGAFARELDHPRWLHVLPNGDVLVAETNGPPKEDGGGLRGWAMGLAMKRAGAAVPSANRITLLRDTDGNGVADLRSVLLEGLHSPFGMALVGDVLYVANADELRRYPYTRDATRIASAGESVLALPGGPINHHWTKNLIASPDGRRLFITVGSNSNVGEQGMAAEAGRAAIWELDLASGRHRIFASGLRNPNGLAWHPQDDALWTVVNERDELGNDLVPDYLTSVQEDAFYGWPYSYFGQHVDARVLPPRPDLVATARVPDYALGSHVAPLGLAWSGDARMPGAFRDGMFIGQHGSWNRWPRSGYSVVFVPFQQGRPVGLPVDVLTGFLSADGAAHGRPVGVAMDGGGGLLVADDVGNAIWRVSSLR